MNQFDFINNVFHFIALQCANKMPVSVSMVLFILIQKGLNAVFPKDCHP